MESKIMRYIFTHVKKINVLPLSQQKRKEKYQSHTET
jgi:hypothetical protein